MTPSFRRFPFVVKLMPECVHSTHVELAGVLMNIILDEIEHHVNVLKQRIFGQESEGALQKIDP